MGGARTEEVEVQKDLVPRQENFPVPVFHRLQERVDHLRGLSSQLLKQNTSCSRGEAAQRATHSFMPHACLEALS